MSWETDTARRLADKARQAQDAARTVRAQRAVDGVDLQANLDLAYAQGVEDVLRYLAGDAGPTVELQRMLFVGSNAQAPLTEDQREAQRVKYGFLPSEEV